MKKLKTFEKFNKLNEETAPLDTIVVYGNKKDNFMPYQTSLNIYKDGDGIKILNAHNGGLICYFEKGDRYGVLGDYGEQLKKSISHKGFIDEKQLNIIIDKYPNYDIFSTLKDIYSILDLSNIKLGKR